MSVAKRVTLFCLVYLVLGGAWILLSDSAAEYLTDSAAGQHLVQTIKGLAYVAGTGALLAVWLWFYLNREEARTQELESSRRRLETFIGNLPGLAYRCLNDEHWTMLELSDGVRDLTGYEPSDFLGNRRLSYEELILEEDRGRVRETVEQEIAQSGCFTVEYRIRTASGTTRWVWERGCAVEGEGKDAALEGIVLDIHDEKLARESLRQSELRFRTAVGEAPVPIMIHVEDGEILALSRAWTELTGYAIEDIPTVSAWTERAYGERQDEVKAVIRKLYELEAGACKAEGEFVVRCADGSERIWDFSSVSLGLLPDGRRIAMSIAADVTGRRQVEGQLRERIEVLDKIFDHVPVMICFVNSEGTIQFVNKEFEEVFGWSQEELRDTSDVMRQIYPNPEYLEDVMSFIREGEGVFKEFTSRTRDGRTLTTEFANVLLSDGTSIGIGLDVTERKNDEEQKERFKTQMHQAQKMESLARFAGGVAHDFKNLLTVVMAEAQLAELNLKAGDPTIGALDRINEAAAKSARLVDRLLLFGRQEGGEPIPVDIAEHVKDTAKLLQPVMGDDVQVHVTAAPDTGTVKIDPVQLEQVITNLCINARDAMPQGGSLTLRTQSVKLSRDQADPWTPLRQGGYVELEVRDNGVGIPIDIQERIFEPFFSTKGEGKGTGLGLATVQSIVQGAGGVVRLESAPGEGTCFRLLFPRHGESEEVAPSVKRDIPGGKERILVVDDDPAVRLILSRILQAKGYEVLTADNPGAALQLAAQKAERIDLLLTDVVMPVMDGPRLAGILSERRPEMKVIYTTGYQEKTAEGIGGPLLHKPFRPNELAERVREILDS